ncbi:MAG: hypothetical protein LUC60_04150 [Lachnospiraceae bacterium]|nr:hypothetical protein [Lachnospiraceae bacterium]
MGNCIEDLALNDEIIEKVKDEANKDEARQQVENVKYAYQTPTEKTAGVSFCSKVKADYSCRLAKKTIKIHQKTIKQIAIASLCVIL